MRIALGQINPTVGDFGGNAAKVLACIERGAKAGVELVIVPELAITGYPPKDLLLKRSFVERAGEALRRIAVRTDRVTAIVGCVTPSDREHGHGLFNSAAVCAGGAVVAMYHKRLLPTYDVFDEHRYFDAGCLPGLVDVVIGGRTRRIGISICEDLWVDDAYFARQLYDGDPILELADGGAEVIVNIGASPFAVGKPNRRVDLFGGKARQCGRPIVYVNQVGGNDDLVFDGASGAFDANGRLIAQACSFDEDFAVVDINAGRGEIRPLPVGDASMHAALVLGTRDYVRKCGFTNVVIGASGGIDSAVTAAIAVEALGAEHVLLVAMPSRYSSDHSLADAQALAASLGARLDVIAINEMHAAADRLIAAQFNGRAADATEENIQARIRGAILMALSNKTGRLVLTTGNKSELSVGYCTLYGDMCGGLAVLSDVPKTAVYRLAAYINQHAQRELIPRNSIVKPPSAELRENQTDQDTLPPYDVLDAVLERYIEQEQSAAEIVTAGFDEATVRRVVRMVDVNEYKRKQAAVGLKVTSRAFGTGRRMPIAARHG